MDSINLAREVIQIEIEALSLLENSIGEEFSSVVEAIYSCKGKVVLTGIGKSGHIGKKISATLSSLGTPSVFLHPSEAQHGDLGVLEEKDIIIMISYSGESEEVVKLITNIKLIGSKMVSITRNSDSTLANNSDFQLIIPKIREADYLGLAPTSSTTATLVIGDALAICLANKKEFSQKDFGLFHPAGALGRRIFCRVSDLMYSGSTIPKVQNSSNIKDVLIEMSYKGLGIVGVLDSKNQLIGVITDGDLRRALEKYNDISSLNLLNLMSKNPMTINQNNLAVDALKKFQETNVGALLVVNDNKDYIGVLKVQDVIRMGISL